MTDRRYGASYADGAATFSLWAPSHDEIFLHLRDAAPMKMVKGADGWHELTTDCQPGDAYQFIVADQRVADPAASAQAHRRVVSWCLVTDPEHYQWQTKDWTGRPWHEVVLYEAHAGLCGGFSGLRRKLPALKEIGFTAIELMPIAQFPGNWNWGYDGVLPFAPDRTYGTPDDLKALVDAAHGLGMMIFLDVVYNHFGPDGNYLGLLAPEFFRHDISTPWGDPIDFRRPEVRQFFRENATAWIAEFRLDGLRFDAVHAIRDEGWLPEMAAHVRAVAPHDNVHLVIENELNDASLLTAGFDAQWNDDFHHVMHVILTGETDAYYADFAENHMQRLARALSEGFIYQGDPSPVNGGNLRGSPSKHLPPTAFVNFLQNHDQIGNRAFGDRLTTLADQPSLRAAIALLILMPAIPLVFMGEEIGSEAPFHYFVDHHPELVEAIVEGRQREFEGLVVDVDDLPEPNARATFEQSKPEADAPRARAWRTYFKQLLDIRHAAIMPYLRGCRALGAEVVGERAVAARWRMGDGRTLLLVANFGDETIQMLLPAETPIYGMTGDGYILPYTTTAWLL
jgi:malto-oligosyltrehalose trehalohydrolase